MITICRSAALLSVFALTANSIAIQETVQLRLKFVAGESMRHRLTQVQSMESEMMGTIESSSAFVIRQNVTEVGADGTATIEVSYEAIKIEIGGPVAASYDSTRDGESAKANDATYAKMFEPMLAATLGMKMAASGKVVEITGFQAMLDKAFDATDDAGPTSTAAMMKEMFNEESLRKMFELNVFPSEPLAVGAKWTRTLDQKMPLLGTLKVEIENTFTGVETHAGLRCAKIGISGTMTIEEGGKSDTMPMDVSLDSPALKGEMFLSLDNGRLIESRIETTMDMHIGSEDESAGGFEMDMSSTVTQRMQLLGKDDPAFE